MKVIAVFVALVAVAVGFPTAPTTWSLSQLSEAINDPSTDPSLLPYLEAGLNEIVTNLMAGVQQEYVNLNLPASASPAVTPIVPAPAVIAPVASETSAANPLVQIILNIKQQTPVASPAVVPVPVAETIVEHDSVAFVDEAINPQAPETNPIDAIAVAVPEINPIDVIAVAAPETNPIDVIAVAVPEISPIDVIAVAAPETNPIDVIAVAAPETNPIDVIAVAAPETNPIDVIAVAAPEISPIDVIAVAAPEINPIDVIAVAAPEIPEVAPVAPETPEAPEASEGLGPLSSSPLIKIIMNLAYSKQVA